MDQEVLIGAGILALLVAASGGGGDPTGLIDEDDPSLDPMDEFEAAAVDFDYESHSPEAKHYDRYLGATWTLVNDWTTHIEDPDLRSGRPRLTTEIFQRLVEKHQELKRWYGERLVPWDRAWRGKWTDPHPRQKDFFARYADLVKQIEKLLSYDVDKGMEMEEPMAESHFTTVHNFNQHFGGDTYSHTTNNLHENQSTNNDFYHHDQSTLHQTTNSYFDDRRYESTKAVHMYQGERSKVSMDCDNAVVSAQNRESGKSIADNAFVAHIEPLRMQPVSEGTNVTSTRARVKEQDHVNLDDPSRHDRKHLMITPGDEKTEEAAPGINAIVDDDPQNPGEVSVEGLGVSIHTDADHFANAAVKVCQTRKTIEPTPINAVALDPHKPPDFQTIPDLTGAGIDLNRPTGVMVTTTSMTTSPPIKTDDRPDFSASQPQSGATAGGTGMQLEIYNSEMAMKVSKFTNLNEQFKIASGKERGKGGPSNKHRIFVAMEKQMNIISNFTPNEIKDAIEKIDRRFTNGFGSIYSLNLKDTQAASRIQAYAQSTPYFATWYRQVQTAYDTYKYVKALGTRKTIKQAGAEAEKTIGEIPPTGFTRTAEEAELDDPEDIPPDMPDVDEPGAKKGKKESFEKELPFGETPEINDPRYQRGSSAPRAEPRKSWLPASEVHGQPVFSQ